jgi:hypothetical protein
LVIETLIKSFAQAAHFDWKAVPVRFPDYENEIVTQGITDDQLARQQKESARSGQKEVYRVFDSARPAFEDVSQGVGGPAATFREFVTRLQVTGGAFWSFGQELYGAAASRPDEDMIRKFIDDCPPFRALLLAICIAQYERCIRLPHSGLSLKAGRFDLFMSVYLPYCDQFVSDDARQRRCLAEVASLSDLKVEILSYEDFRNRLLVWSISLLTESRDRQTIW